MSEVSSDFFVLKTNILVKYLVGIDEFMPFLPGG